jgi:hypothetical protein
MPWDGKKQPVGDVTYGCGILLSKHNPAFPSKKPWRQTLVARIHGGLDVLGTIKRADLTQLLARNSAAGCGM